MATEDYFGKLMKFLDGSETPEQEESEGSFGELVEILYGDETQPQEESSSQDESIRDENHCQSQPQTEGEENHYFANLEDILDRMFGPIGNEKDWMKYDIKSLSQKAGLIMEGERQVDFKLHWTDKEKKPSDHECKGKISLVYLGYAFMGEQDFGIDGLREKFGIQEGETLIRRIPEDLKVIEKDGVKAIKIGQYVDLDEMMVKATLRAGLAGTWDEKAFIICAAPEYSFLIDYIVENLKPNGAKIGITHNFFGPNLVIKFD